MTEPDSPQPPRPQPALPAVQVSAELVPRESGVVSVRPQPGPVERLRSWAVSPAGRSAIAGVSASVLSLAGAHVVRRLLQPPGALPGGLFPAVPADAVVIEVVYARLRVVRRDR